MDPKPVMDDKLRHLRRKQKTEEISGYVIILAGIAFVVWLFLR